MYELLNSEKSIRLGVGNKELAELLKDVQMDPKSPLSYSVSTDNGNCLRIDNQVQTEDGYAFDVTAREHGFAAITLVVSEQQSGKLLAIAGKQFFVPRAAESIKVGELAVVEPATKPAAAAAAAEQSTATGSQAAAATGGGQSQAAASTTAGSTAAKSPLEDDTVKK